MTTPDLPEARISSLLEAKGWTLATAESCSGGLIAHRLTNISGCSGCYAGGAVAYSNPLKESVLGVKAETLKAHGAVSEEVAREMAEGARTRFAVDIAVGVTGIAGPGGGTAEKPVGLVYIGVATAHDTVVTRNHFKGTREEVKAQTADKAFAMILEQLA